MSNLNKDSQTKRFYEPLHEQDTQFQTLGCRHTDPDICKKNGLETVCAFVRKDGMCKSPSSQWAKQYRKLKKE